MPSSLPDLSGDSVAFPLAFLEALSAPNSTQSIIEILARWLPCFIESHRASISLVQDDAHLSVAAFTGDGIIPVKLPLPIAETSCGWSFQNRQVRLISDIARLDSPELDLRMLDEGGLRCVINAPLLSGSECLGVLNLAHKTPNFYRAEHARQLENLALWVAPQIALRRRAELAEATGRKKAAFVAKLSHEIRMPLNSVLGMAQLMKNTALDQTQLAYVEAIAESGQSLRMLVEDLQDVAQIEAGLLMLESAPFDLAELVRQTVDAVAAAAAQKGLTVWSHLSDNCAGDYLGDADRIRRVLFNLIDNAVKYTSMGEVKITVAPTAEDEVCFTVTDSGPGVAQEQQAAIFESFRRTNLAGGDPSGESGLGLVMAGQLVAMMDGQIGVQSSPAQGATFWFALPLGQVQAQNEQSAERPGRLMPLSNPAFEAQPMPAIPGPAIPGPAMLADIDPVVLLAEDNGLNQELMLCALEPLGLEIVTARNGAEALKCLRERPFDLVLMDIQMPVMTGDEAIRQIRASKASYAEVPIIALTANAMQGAREEYLNAGATAYLAKPVNVQELIHKVLSYARPQGKQTAVS